MKKTRLIPLLLVAATGLLLLTAACGGDDTQAVPRDAVAVVGGDEITKADFDNLIAQAKRSYPKVGSTEYNALKNQAIQFLVQRSEFEQKADGLDVNVSTKQVDARLKQVKQQYFGGDEKKYKDQLKQQGLTDTQVRADIRAQLVQEGIFKKLTEDVNVTDKQIEDYYNSHKAQYGTPESRAVRHILVSSNALADKLYKQLKAGANFAALAKKYSKDPGSKDQGGKLTITRGQTVLPFDQTAFNLGTGTLSQPIKTQYGYHLIQPLSKVKP